MPSIPLGEWAPDAAAVDSPAMTNVTNVFAQASGYGPVKTPSAASSALPAPCKGAVAVRMKSGTYQFYAGTATGLYKLDPVSTTWTDVSRAGATYFVPDDDYWSFALFGDRLLATHVNDGPQFINVESGTAFANVGGSPPRSRFVSVVGDFVVLGGLTDYPNRLQWSGLNDSDFWTPGLNYSDVQDFPDGGRVAGVSGGEFGIVFQEDAIRRMIFAPGTPEVFQFSKVEDGRGAVAPWSVVQAGPRIFFLDNNGFYAYTGGASTDIGADRVNRWFRNNADLAYIGKAVGIADITASRVMWAFKSQSASDPNLLDVAIIYDWTLNRWTKIERSIRYWIGAATPAVSIDTISGSIDAITGSFDSALYAGGVPTMAVFGTDNILAFLEGPAMEATLETADAMLARPGRAMVRGVRLDGDSSTFGVRVGRRESLNAAVAFDAETTPNSERIATARASARYHRARIRIPASETWTYASAIEIDAVPEGLR